MIGSMTYGQSLFSPQAVGMGAFGALASDSRSFVFNPAGLTSIRDWDIGAVTYFPTSIEGVGFVLQGFSFGKRFLQDNAVAIQYSPGTSLEFVLPGGTFTPSQGSTPVTIETRVTYDEQFSLGYARMLSREFSVGFSGRLRREKINDTQVQIVGGTLVFPKAEQEALAWIGDVGLTWKFLEKAAVSAVGRNLFHMKYGELTGEYASFRLPFELSLEMGIAYQFTPTMRTALDVSTAKSGALGIEWKPGFSIAARSGVYFNEAESPFAYALGFGVGWSYMFLEFDAAYLYFLDKSKREGTGSLASFDAGSIKSIDLNPYTADRISLSVKTVLGNVRESLASIESVELAGGIYPSSSAALAYRPIGKARIKNTSSRPIQAKASFFIEKYMDAPTESQAVYLQPGESQEVPLTAVFNELVRGVQKMTVKEGTVYVSAQPADDYDDRYQTRILLYGKNDWDGDVLTLRYFVTPDDPAVIRYTRDILLEQRDSIDAASRDLVSFHKARVLFNAFAGKLVYVSDPKQSADYVQYPSETLQLRGGDCDDMTVCFSSLLNSVGVSTAFIDVIPPEDSTRSHIYLLFDTGVDPKFGGAISSNPKRYIIRKNSKGVETIWIPVETTVIARGFDDAWTTGAQEWFDDVEIGLGLLKGWVRIVDVY